MAKKKKCADCPKLISNRAQRCRQCASKHPNSRRKKVEAATAHWQDVEFRQKMMAVRQDPEYRRNLSEQRTKAHKRGVYGVECSQRKSKTLKRLWQIPEYRQKQLKVRASPEFREKFNESMRTSEIRQRRSEDRTLWWTPERRENQSKRFSGSCNPNWQGGKSFEPYAPEWTEELKFQTRQRDAFRCLVCGKPENGTAWDVHHCDYSKTNNDPSNLATLCKSCHGRAGTDREYWQAYFTGQGYELMLGAY